MSVKILCIFFLLICVSGKQKYRVAVVEQPPFVQKIGEDQSFEGFCVDLLEMIAQKVEPPFEYEFYKVENNKYGGKLKNGSFFGAVGDLVNKKAEIALGALTYDRDVQQYIDSTIPFYAPTGSSFLKSKDAPSISDHFYAHFAMRGLRPAEDDGSSPKVIVLEQSQTAKDLKNYAPKFYENLGTNYQELVQNDSKTGALVDCVHKATNIVANRKDTVLLADANLLRYKAMVDCRVSVDESEIWRRPYVIGLQKSSPLKDEISSAIVDLLNNREIERLTEKWWAGIPEQGDC